FSECGSSESACRSAYRMAHAYPNHAPPRQPALLCESDGPRVITPPIPTRGLLADAEPEDGDDARPRAADRFQVYPGEARGREGDPVAEQHRQYIHQDLVDEPPPQALAGHVGAQDLQVLAARAAARR